MRIILFMLFLYLLASCTRGKLYIPPESAICGLALPVWLQEDTVVVYPADYFPQPEKIKKITLSRGLEMVWSEDRQSFRLFAVGVMEMPGNMRIRYDGYKYDIPVLLKSPVTSGDTALQIMTDELAGDTVYFRSSGRELHWVAYLQNYKLNEKLLLISGDRLGVVLPEEATQLKWGELRIWAYDGKEISNNVLVPLVKGRVVTEASELIRFDGKEGCTILSRRMLSEDLKYVKVDSVEGIRGARWMQKVGGSKSLNDTAYCKLVQLLAFYATIPGVSGISCDDEIGMAGENAPDSKNLASFDSLSSEGRMVKAKSAALNHLRCEHMALLYGDFIPLRVEDRVYAYLRSYFQKDVVVVFNKGEEMMTLKLDLPCMGRDERFESLFDSRFSYDNSKLILDVAANGVEVIYN